MRVVGIVGGIGSGKSHVARRFERFGAVRIDADRVGHEILEQPQVKSAIRSQWGSAVFEASGSVSRSQLARAVFVEDPRELAILEQITHPQIASRIETQLETLSQSGSLVLLDAPLLLKAGWDRFCDRILFVECDLATRQRRCATRGWSPQMHHQREQSQTDLDTKRRRASDSIDGTLEEALLDSTINEMIRFWT